MRALGFMFATGIENSIPTIHNGTVRHDQMASCGHYDRWEQDFDLVQELGIKFLRYGPPLHTTLLGHDWYDWSFADATLWSLLRRGITPIVDLCHFGVPDWIGNFQNPDFPEIFARYAGAFAHRYPWIRCYTPINEMFICALFSARFGWWNEQLADDRSFVTCVRNLVRANVRAMEEIAAFQTDAVFIQAEAVEAHHADAPDILADVRRRNRERFITLDLNYGRPVESKTLSWLLDHGLSNEDYVWFMTHGPQLRRRCVLGADYYDTNEHAVRSDGSAHVAGSVLGFHGIAREYHNRYGLPLMLTETNMDTRVDQPDRATRWLKTIWRQTRFAIDHLNVPVVGFTWFSLIDQMDWDVSLREKRDRPIPLGLADLDRTLRPVGRLYAEIIRRWSEPDPNGTLQNATGSDRMISSSKPAQPARLAEPLANQNRNHHVPPRPLHPDPAAG